MRHKILIPLAIGSAFSLFALKTGAGSTDANGNSLPDRSDGKSIVYDQSKETPAPPIEQGCIPPKETEFRLGLPGWISGVEGDFGVKGVVTDQDVKFTDILPKLDMIVAGSLYARYHRWEVFADGQYLKLSDTAELPGILFDRANVAAKSAFAEAFIGYRLINCDKGYLSLVAGARYNYMRGELHIHRISDPRFPIIINRLGIPNNLRVSGETDWVDPVIGLAGKVRVWKPLSAWAKADFGGFGAASDFTWQAQGGVEIQMTRWMWTDIGWRYLKFDYHSGGFTNETEFNGPYIETGINF
jgi:hypothetical protein